MPRIINSKNNSNSVKLFIIHSFQVKSAAAALMMFALAGCQQNTVEPDTYTPSINSIQSEEAKAPETLKEANEKLLWLAIGELKAYLAGAEDCILNAQNQSLSECDNAGVTAPPGSPSNLLILPTTFQTLSTGQVALVSKLNQSRLGPWFKDSSLSMERAVTWGCESSITWWPASAPDPKSVPNPDAVRAALGKELESLDCGVPAPIPEVQPSVAINETILVGTRDAMIRFNAVKEQINACVATPVKPVANPHLLWRKCLVSLIGNENEQSKEGLAWVETTSRDFELKGEFLVDGWIKINASAQTSTTWSCRLTPGPEWSIDSENAKRLQSACEWPKDRVRE